MINNRIIKTLATITLSLSFFALLANTVGAKAAQQTTINFSGYNWIVKSGVDGPGPNNWDNSPNAVYVDAQGRLHLWVTNQSGQWSSSEVYLPKSLGYGTYSFNIDNSINQEDQNLVSAAFLYQDDTHEYDYEFSTWKNGEDYNAQFVVQPANSSTLLKRFPLQTTSGSSVFNLTWSPANLLFQALSNNTVFNQFQYSGQYNFVPGGEVVHLNHWMIDGSAPSDNKPHDFIINSFTFTPAGSTTTTTTSPTTTVTTPTQQPIVQPVTPIVTPIITPVTPVVTPVTPVTPVVTPVITVPTPQPIIVTPPTQPTVPVVTNPPVTVTPPTTTTIKPTTKHKVRRVARHKVRRATSTRK